jgi:hypothetical protein
MRSNTSATVGLYTVSLDSKLMKDMLVAGPPGRPYISFIARPSPFKYVFSSGMKSGERLSQTGFVDRTGIDRSTMADIVRRLRQRRLQQGRRTKEHSRV